MGVLLESLHRSWSLARVLKISAQWALLMVGSWFASVRSFFLLSRVLKVYALGSCGPFALGRAKLALELPRSASFIFKGSVSSVCTAFCNAVWHLVLPSIVCGE